MLLLVEVIKDQNPPHVKVLSRVPQTLCLLSSGFVLHARLSCVFLSSSPAYHILFLLDLPVMDLPACFWTLIIQPTPHWICLPVWLISRFWPLPELISKLNFPCHFDCLVVVLLGSTPPVPLNVIVQSGQHKPSRLWFTPRAAGGAGQCPSAPWQTTYLYSRRVCRRWRLATRRAWALFRNSSRGSPCWTMDCVLCRPPVLWPRLPCRRCTSHHQNVIPVLRVPAGHSLYSVPSPFNSSLPPFPQRGPGWHISSLWNHWVGEAISHLLVGQVVLHQSLEGLLSCHTQRRGCSRFVQLDTGRKVYVWLLHQVPHHSH